MKSVRKSSLKSVAFVIVVAALVAGCQKKQAEPAKTNDETATRDEVVAGITQQAKERLLSEVSGVWKPDTGTGLTVISAAGNTIQIVQGETLLPVALGDIDTNNNNVNFKLFLKNGNQEIRTITSTADGDQTAAIIITAADGSQRRYDLVRRVSQDDLNRIGALSTQGPSSTQGQSASTPAVEKASSATDNGVVDMYLGAIDMNMRSCPGSTCASVLIVPKDSTVSVDKSTIREVTETSGVNTPWVRVTYEGAYCSPSDPGSQADCVPTLTTHSPMTGWMNYTRLLDAPRQQ